MTVTGTLDVRHEVAEIGPLLWRLAGLRSILYETERYILAGTLRDVADELDHGDCRQRLVLITPSGPDGRPLYRIGERLAHDPLSQAPPQEERTNPSSGSE